MPKARVRWGLAAAIGALLGFALPAGGAYSVWEFPSARAAESPPGGNSGSLVRYLALNVSDLDKSIAFYSRGLGMKELRRFQSPDGAPIVAIGYAGADSSDKYDQLQPASLLLTIGKEPVRQVAGFRLVLQTPDIRRLFDDLAKVIPASGGKIIMAPKLDPYAPALTVGLAEDPSGYQLEIMQRN